LRCLDVPLIGNICPGKQTRFLSTLKNLAAACFPFSSANLITFNLKEKLYLCLALFLDSVLSKKKKQWVLVNFLIFQHQQLVPKMCTYYVHGNYREENNANDKFAVKLVRNDGNKEQCVGHVPIELSKVFNFFLKEVAKYLQL
jgi:hypothetical protein